MTQATDFNERTSYFYYDAVGRSTQTVMPTGGRQTASYSDDGMFVQAQMLDAANNAQSTTLTFFNGRGQERASSYFSRNTPNFWDGANFVETNTRYDRMGRRTEVSLPHPANTAISGWTTFQYDALSRVTQTTAPDGSVSQTFYNETTPRPGSASAEWGQTVRSRDAWGRERWARTDDFGRLKEVVEPNPAGDGSVSNAGSEVTKYHYNARDELTLVEQGEQTRWFAYDSLGRLTRQKLAEQTATINDAGTYVGAGGGARWSDGYLDAKLRP